MPMQAQRGETELRFQTIRNLALGRDGWSAMRCGRFTLRKESVPIVQEAELTSGQLWAVAETSP